MEPENKQEITLLEDEIIENKIVMSARSIAAFRIYFDSGVQPPAMAINAARKNIDIRFMLR